MIFEELPVRADGELTHVNDMVEVDRTEARRRLDFIAAKLASHALHDVELGDVELDALSSDDFDRTV